MRTLFVMLIVSATVGAGELCDGLAETAEMVMKLRQNGTDVTTLMNKLEATPVEDEADSVMSELIENIIIMAYSKPLMYSEEGKSTSIREFKTSIYLECKRGL